jgi:hypothetical protein
MYHHLARYILCISVLALSSIAQARSFNVSANPIGLITGSYSAGVDVAVADRVTVGPYAAYSHTSDNVNGLPSTSTSTGFGLRTDIALSDTVFKDGWYLSPFVSRYKVHTQVSNDSTSLYRKTAIDFAALNAGLVLGYGWFWDAGINLRFGLGPMYTKVTGDFELEKNDGSKVKPKVVNRLEGFLPTAELILAWAF